MPHCFSPKERPNWEALLKPSLFYIISVVSQVLIYRWLFLQVSHKILAENPKSVASEMVSKPLLGKHMGVWVLGRAWDVNQLRLWFPPKAHPPGEPNHRAGGSGRRSRPIPTWWVGEAMSS